MRSTRTVRAALLGAAAILLAALPAVQAQTIGPGGIPIAPGPSQPRYVPGGIGPGGTPIAPGPAARGRIQEIGPGGVPFAPGPAGAIQRRRPVRPVPTTVAGSSTISSTIMTDEGTHAPRYRPHARRRHRPRRD